MEILSVKRQEDYVRFNFLVEIQESEALKLTINVCGNLESLSGSNYVLPFIDDFDWDSIEFLGKPVKYKEFKVMYDKLFKESFDEFVTRVDKLAESAIHSQMPNSLANASPLTLAQLFRDRASDVWQHNGKFQGTALWDDWTLCRLAEALGFKCDRVKNYTNNRGVEIAYEMPVLLSSTVEQILKKI